MAKKKKNMGKVIDLINAAPDNAVITDGRRTYTKSQALESQDLKVSGLLEEPVHSVKDGMVFIEMKPKFLTRPVIVMAVKIEKPKESSVERKDYPDPEGHDDQD